MLRAPLLASLALMSACTGLGTSTTSDPGRPGRARDPARAADERSAHVRDDRKLDQRIALAELQLLEKEAQVEELQARLDDARREVVRAMGKLTSLATRAEAASGIAEAEIALQSLRASAAPQGAQEVAKLMRLSTAEFDRQNYAGALYLANQAKTAAVAAQGQLASVERGSLRRGEVPFALPLQLQASARANLRDGPGSGFAVIDTVTAGAPLTAHSYTGPWVRITDEAGRRGWIHQSLIVRRRP